MKAQICIAQVYGVGFINLDIVTDTVLLKGTMSACNKTHRNCAVEPRGY